MKYQSTMGTSESRLPEGTSVVVIGGGIVGVCTAFYLARQGIDVVLCEKGDIACEQSSRNWGWIISVGRDRREIPLTLLSSQCWQELSETVGPDLGYRQTGVARLYDTEAPIAAATAWCDYARPLGADGRMLSGAEIARLFPGASRPFRGAIYSPTDAVAEPQTAVPAIARHAASLGARMVSRCAVRALDVKAGRTVGVFTEKGYIRTDAVVLAGGAWSRHFCETLGIRLSQLIVQASVMRTAPFDAGLETAGVVGNFSFRKRRDGGYTIGDPFNTLVPVIPASFRLAGDFLPQLRMSWRRLRPSLGRFAQEWRYDRLRSPDGVSAYEKMRINDPGPRESFLRAARRHLIERFPAFAEVPIAESWAGILDVTPDAIPVISAAAEISGFYVGTGFSGHGFTLGPGAGHVLASLAAGHKPAVDLTPFRLSRFVDGSPLAPQVGF